ncbi:prenyltransferase/squalene oxidase repeat-containing protein [Planctomicrobium sp. SH664]|uniref:prenyltransferase/squalene oxidase repeat-containing protein n=1 Tax=Planctomicrobium sp. SH664 TaxID=3448125 RepID=UPI003F5CA5C2
MFRRFTIGLCVLLMTVGGRLPVPEQRVQAQEISPETVDAAIVRALAFLSQEQQPSGCWRTEGWGDSTAITALAVMAYLAAGHTPGEGPYGEQINRGIRWVLSQQQPSGLLMGDDLSHGPMYNHGICTLMLAEVMGMMNSADAPAVKEGLEKAVLLILEAQAVQKFERHRGGWRYQIDSRDSDLSVTGWQVLALRAAKDIGCDVPAESIDEAIAYVKRCAVNKNSGFGYQPGNGATPTMTGTGITCLEVCGDHHSQESLDAAEWLVVHPLNRESAFFFYGVYYTGVGLFKMGGDFAERSRRELAQALLPIQKEDGGWTPEHGNERIAGRAYATSLAVLGLAVDYRYLPIYQR